LIAVLKSLEKVTLPDLPNVEKTVKSMAEELKNDVAQFAKERQVADELLAKVTESQKTLEVQSDVHRAMCITADAGPAQER
jgi:predicted DNA-binding antitoxin AbrB/MazE fold protein